MKNIFKYILKESTFFFKCGILKKKNAQPLDSYKQIN